MSTRDCTEGSEHVSWRDVSTCISLQLLIVHDVMFLSCCRFGYSHYLHANEFAARGVEFVWEDIICQYWPWAERKRHLFPELMAKEIKPALSVMHAKAHSWHCQVVII